MTDVWYCFQHTSEVHRFFLVLWVGCIRTKGSVSGDGIHWITRKEVGTILFNYSHISIYKHIYIYLYIYICIYLRNHPSISSRKMGGNRGISNKHLNDLIRLESFTILTWARKTDGWPYNDSNFGDGDVWFAYQIRPVYRTKTMDFPIPNYATYLWVWMSFCPSKNCGLCKMVKCHVCLTKE